jgi:hypothetical protein
VSDEIPVVTMQQLVDAGLNAFGLQLFVESICDKKDAKDFRPVIFVYKGLRVTLQPEPGMEIDGRHQ